MREHINKNSVLYYVQKFYFGGGKKSKRLKNTSFISAE